jgi:hypothetical protein
MKNIRWSLSATAAFGAMALLLIAAYAWVAFYSHVLEPGHTFDFYQQYAQTASPVVAIAAGTPLFYFAARRITRATNLATALAFWACAATADATATLIAGSGYLVCAAAIPLKFAAVRLGASHAAR